MYNYYIYKKQKDEEMKKKEEEEKLNKEKKIQKIKTNYLSLKYNKRILKFILGLVKEPIVINDYVNPIENTRNKFLKEKENKKINFKFKNYIPDKERIVYN